MGSDTSKLDEEKWRRQEEERRAEDAEAELEQVQERLRKMEVKKKEEANLTESVNKLRAKIKRMKPGDSMPYFDETEFPKKLMVGIYGTTGIGKTSLMNSIRYAVEGGIDRNVWCQAAAAEFMGGHTMMRRKIPVTPHLTFVDTRGIGAEDLKGTGASAEMVRQLEGKSSFAREVDWSGSTGWTRSNANKAQRIFCTILVFSARSSETVKSVIGRFVRVLFKWQGRYPLAVITHAETSRPEELKKTRFLLLSSGISDIYEVENLNTENKKFELEPEYQLTLLQMLERCMVDGDAIFQLRYEIDQEEKCE